VLLTDAGERMEIVMRDSGFEFCYQGKFYYAKGGYVEPFKLSERGNQLVLQNHKEEVSVVNKK
jgi:hypothetical protein